MSLLLGPRRGSGAAPVHTGLSPWQQLVTAVGGNIAAGGAEDPLVPALWYPGGLVTLDDGAASAIPDCRSLPRWTIAFAFAMFWTRVRTAGDITALQTFAATLGYSPAS